MTISHKSGPEVIFGQSRAQYTGVPADYNPGMAPSAAYGGMNVLDVRVGYNPGQPRGYPIPAWVGQDVLLVSQVPSSAATNAIASTQSATTGAALTLIASSAQGIVPGVSITGATSSVPVTGLLSIEGSAAMINYAPTSGSVQSYDPRTMLSRVVTINNLTATADASITYNVVGYDVYGYRMTDSILGGTTQSSVGAITTVNGNKAFKYIQSVTPSGASAATNVSVGTADIFGFPLVVYDKALTFVQWASATISGTGITVGSTASTLDPRGLYASSSASDNAKKLMMQVMIPPWAYTPSTSAPGVLSSTGLTGTQS